MLNENTRQVLFRAYEGESKARTRLEGFAERADEEGKPQAAVLFRAMSGAAGVHARNNLRLLGAVGTTAENLEYVLTRGTNLAFASYNTMFEQATDEGEPEAAQVFRWMRDAEAGHAELYRKVHADGGSEKKAPFYVCIQCGLIMEGDPPAICPVCGMPRETFMKVE